MVEATGGARQRLLWLLWTVMFVASLGAVVGARPLDGGPQQSRRS